MLQGIIAERRPGDKVEVLVKRDGKEKQISVVLENRQGNTKLKKKEYNEVLNMLGAELENLDKDVAKKLKIDGGVKVTELYAGKLRRQTQMKEGFIITHIDGRKIKNVEEVMDVIEDKDGGVMLEGVYEDMPGKYYYAFGLNS
jgi:S1-C subfamily serine protease